MTPCHYALLALLIGGLALLAAWCVRDELRRDLPPDELPLSRNRKDDA